MTNGLQITNNVNIPDAKDTDFSLNTNELGGMHYQAVKTFKFSNATTDSRYFTPYTLYTHGLGYVPAFLAFDKTGILYGIQNSIAGSVNTVAANSQYLLILFGASSDISVIIFEEKISDN